MRTLHHNIYRIRKNNSDKRKKLERNTIKSVVMKDGNCRAD